MKGRRRVGADEPEEAPAWLLTYGDLMSLLLVFFVLLVSFSSIQESKFHEAADSLRGAFGVMSSAPTVLQLPEVAAARTLAQERQAATDQARELEQSLLAAGLDREVDIAVTELGVAIRVNAPFLFASGRAELRPEAKALLARLGGFLNRFPQQPVRVEGHTDAVPISSARFASNWELSAARAVTVAKEFQAGGMAPARLSAAGYGEHRPVAGNETAEERARNRRVEILMEWRR
ncbi:MAG: OmpA/MotB family protein [Candidatus Krumholzibacteriia bacterium]